MELDQCASCLLCAAELSPREARRLIDQKRTIPRQNKSALNLVTRGSRWRTKRSFVVVSARDSGGAEVKTATAVVTEKPKLGRFQVSKGHPAPFGASARDGGVNFSIYSGNAVSATLCLISLSDLQDVSFVLLFYFYFVII